MKKFRLFAVVLAVMIITTGSFVAAPYVDVSNLNDQQKLQVNDITHFILNGDYETAYREMVYYKLPTYVNEGFMNGSAEIAPGFTTYVDELKAAGCLPSDYTLPGTSAPATETPAADTGSAPAAEPAPEPVKTEFTVEDMPDTDMWATQQVNVRSGADTTYNKVATLSQYDKVVVNGKASTGWYRLKTEDGSEQYVSDKFLTTEDPSNRTVNVYDENTGKVNTYEFEDTDPEVIDEIVEEIKEESKAEPEVIEEPEPVEEPEEEIAEPAPVEEETTPEKEPFDWRGPLYIFGAVFGVCIIVVSVVIIRKRK